MRNKVRKQVTDSVKLIENMVNTFEDRWSRLYDVGIVSVDYTDGYVDSYEFTADGCLLITIEEHISCGCCRPDTWEFDLDVDYLLLDDNSFNTLMSIESHIKEEKEQEEKEKKEKEEQLAKVKEKRETILREKALLADLKSKYE